LEHQDHFFPEYSANNSGEDVAIDLKSQDAKKRRKRKIRKLKLFVKITLILKVNDRIAFAIKNYQIMISFDLADLK